jgi:hypothetical protein
LSVPLLAIDADIHQHPEPGRQRGRRDVAGRDFRTRNATAWGNDRTGEDLIRQIDPHFVLGPAATAAVH